MARPTERDLDATPVADLREEVIRLGPWHLDVEINPELSTRASLEVPPGFYPASFGKVEFRSAREAFLSRMLRVYPNGLEGRRVLDCACNCGAYLFWVKEIGAGECLGFDVRKHWIDQAEFLRKYRRGPTEQMRFEVCDLYDLPSLQLGQFDVTLFHGIFYHLPEPLGGLRIAADLTDELLVLNTAARTDFPDGVLVASQEGRSQVMSGVYGLNWFPSGPEVLTQILNWAGFAETRCSRWRRAEPKQPDALGRIEMLAGRENGLFDAFDEEPDPRALAESVQRIARNTLPSDATVLVAGIGDGVFETEGLRALPFPGAEIGSREASPPEDEAIIEQLEGQRADGAQYLLVSGPSHGLLEQHPGFRKYLEQRYQLELREHGVCEIYSLKQEV